MVKSEKAKELAAKQKAQIKAEKLRKKNSTNPADWGRIRQIRETYKLTHKHDPQLGWLLLAAFAIPVITFIVIGIWAKSWILWPLFGLSLGILLAMLLFARRAKHAAYKRYEGQAGSAEVALSMLPKQWISTPAIAANRQMDVIHRTIGPGGLFLIGEGEPGRLKSLLTSEIRRHEQVAYGVTVQTVIMGDKTGQVPLSKLANYLRKRPKQLRTEQITEVRARLKALDAMRGRAPIPKGPMPSMKGARQAMRGK